MLTIMIRLRQLSACNGGDDRRKIDTGLSSTFRILPARVCIPAADSCTLTEMLNFQTRLDTEY